MSVERNARQSTTRLQSNPVAVLVSGGLDSAALVASLLVDRPVQPIYVSCGLVWERAERAAVTALTALLASPSLQPVVDFAMPLEDLYGDHWSIRGEGVPAADTPDDAVGMLGRNAVLAIKPLLWCVREGVASLAIGSLAGNPFDDASPAFFRQFAEILSTAAGGRVELVAPFRDRSKVDLIRSTPPRVLAASMSCLSPVKKTDGWWHCGGCNKCGERRRAFRDAGVPDPTPYLAEPR